jgi:hypothetical protein
MMSLDFAPASEHREASGALRAIDCANGAIPRLLGKRGEEFIDFVGRAPHQVDELVSRAQRTSLDLVPAAFCTADILVDDSTIACCRKPTQHAFCVARQMAKHVGTCPFRKSTRMSYLVVTEFDDVGEESFVSAPALFDIFERRVWRRHVRTLASTAAFSDNRCLRREEELNGGGRGETLGPPARSLGDGLRALRHLRDLNTQKRRG